MNDSVKPELLSVADRLASLPNEVQQLFTDPEHGTPDNISKAGCLALAKLGKDAWNAWRGAFPVTRDSLNKHVNHADFSGHDFRPYKVNFAEFDFGDAADFSKTHFAPGACFRMTRWGEMAKLDGSFWGGHADFRGARWGVLSSFVGSTWGIYANFSGAQLALEADFRNTEWGYFADFSGAQWRKAHFSDSVWQGYATFSGMSWEELGSKVGSAEYLQSAKPWAEANGLAPDSLGETNFARAKFLGSPDKSKVTFWNRKFVCKANFGCDFEIVPEFHEGELHQDTSFDGAVFPPATGSDEAARAYRTLKLAFSKQQALREEQRFFRLEMAEEAKSSGRAKWLYWLYKESCDYGFSLWRPISLFFIFWLVFAQIYGHYASTLPSCLLFESACVALDKQYEFSLAQALPFSGFDKLEYFKNGNDSLFKDVPVWLLAIHKAISLALLFLTGLALRNLFRLK